MYVLIHFSHKLTRDKIIKVQRKGITWDTPALGKYAERVISWELTPFGVSISTFDISTCTRTKLQT